MNSMHKCARSTLQTALVRLVVKACLCVTYSLHLEPSRGTEHTDGTETNLKGSQGRARGRAGLQWLIAGVDPDK